MAWYALQQYDEIEGNNPSLVIAFANLLKKFDRELDPVVLSKILTQDEPEVDWWSLSEYFDPIQHIEIEQNADGWPTTANAIVRLVRVDETTGESFEHYCLVADPLARSIIDSLDGKVKSAKAYGEATGWASYEQEADSYNIIIESERDTWPEEPKEKPGRRYTLEEYETIWDVARKTGILASTLMEHNGITDPKSVKPGDTLHLPLVTPIPPQRQTTYTLLPTPKPMHIFKTGGAKKYAFGNPKEIDETGPRYAENTNVTIFATAHVPIGETTRDYYMDAFSLGDYHATGRVAFTSGFLTEDLAEGHVFDPPPPPLPADQIEVIVQPGWDLARVLSVAGYPVSELEDPNIYQTALVDKSLVSASELPRKVRVYKYVAPEPEPEVSIEEPKQDVPEPDVSSGPNSYKTTYQLLPEATLFVAKESMMVYEFDGRRPERQLQENQNVLIAGTFEHEGVLLGRPKAAADNGYWFGIPMSNLITEDELFNTDLTLNERIALHKRLSPTEKVVDSLSRMGTKYEWMLKRATQKIKDVTKDITKE